MALFYLINQENKHFFEILVYISNANLNQAEKFSHFSFGLC